MLHLLTCMVSFMQSFMTDDSSSDFYRNEASWMDTEKITAPEGSGSQVRIDVLQNPIYTDTEEDMIELGDESGWGGRSHKPGASASQF